MNEFILSPPVAFIIFLMVTFLLYKAGGVMGPKTKKEGKKLSPYFCGESRPGEKMQPNYHFFRFAFFFLILDVAVLVIATVPGGTAAWLGLLYLITLFILVIILLLDREVD